MKKRIKKKESIDLAKSSIIFQPRLKNNQNENAEVVLLKLIKILYKDLIANKRVTLIFMSIFNLLFALRLFFLVEDYFSSEAKILGVSDSGGGMNIGQLSGLAGSFGFNLPKSGSASIHSSILFPDIIRSRTMLEKLLMKTYKIDNKQKTLVEILNDLDSLSEEQTPQNLYIGVDKLSNMISVRMDEITGLIKLKSGRKRSFNRSWYFKYINIRAQ